MEKRVAKYLIDVGLLISGALCAVTGIIKLPLVLRFVNTGNVILPIRQLTRIHDLSGVIFVLLIIAHLTFNWRWMVGMTRTLMKPPK